MNLTGVDSRYPNQYAQLPSIQDVAAVLAARPSMAQLSQKAVAEATTGQDKAVDLTKQIAAAANAGRVDLYL